MLRECECIWRVQRRNIMMMMTMERMKESWTLSSWCCTKSQATVSRKVSSCLCGEFRFVLVFFFFFFSVVFAIRPNRFAHIRSTADTVAIMGIECGWPPSCHLATFCLFFVCILRASVCVCVFLSTIHAHLRCLIALGYIHIRCLLARKRDCDCN